MIQPLVLLFDIDGTLVTTGGAGRRAMERAFEAITGKRDAASFPFAGMTDRAIARAGLENAGVNADELAIDRLLAHYVDLLEHEVAAASEYGVYPGVNEAVDAALARQRAAVGLGTGNVRDGARIKLRRVDLADRFAFGGFGCDHEDRAELIRVGAGRGAERLGMSIDECRVVVIGDTERDVDAALAIGAECIAVGTGGVPLERLRARGAAHAFDTLAAAGALEALLR